VVVEPGNHWVHGPALELATALPLIEVLHFPIRSYEQFEHKVVRDALGYLALADRPPEVGRDQLRLYEIYRQGGLPDYFSRAMLDDEAIGQGIARGELVVDRRLERFLSSGAEKTHDFANLLAVTRLAGEAFALAEHGEDLGADLAAQKQVTAATQSQLDDISRELQVLRDSRLVRWTAPLRSLYYRAGRKRS
jgi:hypothetical protein